MHPGGACESCFAPFLSVRMAVPVWGGSGDFMPLTRTTFRTLPSHAQGSCAPWGSVRKLFGALPARAKAPLRAARAREGRFGRFRMHAADPSLAPTARAPINQSTCARSPRVHRCFVHLRGVCESPAAPFKSCAQAPDRPSRPQAGRRRPICNGSKGTNQLARASSGCTDALCIQGERANRLPPLLSLARKLLTAPHGRILPLRRRSGGFCMRPAGTGRRFAPSPQVHKATVHPGGACAS